jgi:hypothetical protein
MLINRYGKCPVPGCEEAATEGHHILYDYHQHGPVIERLCPEHHRWITRRQSHAARKQRHALSEKQRWFFWYELKGGKMRRPRSTALDREWVEQSTIGGLSPNIAKGLQYFKDAFASATQPPEEQRQEEIQQEEIQPKARRKAVRKAKKPVKKAPKKPVKKAPKKVSKKAKRR